MLTLDYLRHLLSLCAFNDWQFVAGEMGDGFYLQVRFKDCAAKEWSGRKWYVSRHSTRSEVVQTAFKAVLTAVEHEAREQFTYWGTAIFGPHFDVEALLDIAEKKDVRSTTI
jgi:hypothetical protein